MQPLLLLILISAAAAGPPAAPAPAGEAAFQAPVQDKGATVKHGRLPHPLRYLGRIGQAEVDFAIRLSSWGIERETPRR